ncbi:MAG: cytochrome b/b6 domain-containing protein [Archaeoglobaceae archaeon]
MSETEYTLTHEHREEYSADTVEVTRHSLSVRACHWGIVVTGIILALTGMQMGGLYGLKVVYEQTMALHMWAGLIFGALWIFFTYYILAYEWKWISLGRIPYAINYLLAETKAWFGGEHVEDPRGYDSKSKKYVEKIVPTQVMVWWIYLVLTILMGVTGLSMFYRFEPVLSFSGSIAPIFGSADGYTILRAAHRLGMFLFATVMIMHVYAVIVFGVLKSMVTGNRKEKVKD